MGLRLCNRIGEKMNSEIFEREFSAIEDEKIRKFTETALNNLPNV